jgi:hypothetical protein
VYVSAHFFIGRIIRPELLDLVSDVIIGEESVEVEEILAVSSYFHTQTTNKKTARTQKKIAHKCTHTQMERERERY